MKNPRIAASSYSNTAPLIWSFLYGSQRGKYEIILDIAPSRSAELLLQRKVDAALVPVIAAQMMDDVWIVPEVCVGAREKAKSVCLITKDKELSSVKSVSLDIYSKTSVVLTKIIFKEFLGFEPEWINAKPNADKMLSETDCALLIGDPALMIDIIKYERFDLVELWKRFTGFGFVFAMWMTRNEACAFDFASARDEGLKRFSEIISNYKEEIPLSREEFETYLTKNISFSVDESMKRGMELYFELAAKNKFINLLTTPKFCQISENQ